MYIGGSNQKGKNWRKCQVSVRTRPESPAPVAGVSGVSQGRKLRSQDKVSGKFPPHGFHRRKRLRTKRSRSLDTPRKLGGMFAETLPRPESPAPEAGVSAPLGQSFRPCANSSKVEIPLRTRPETCRKLAGVSGPEKFPPHLQRFRGPETPGLRAGVSGVK